MGYLLERMDLPRASSNHAVFLAILRDVAEAGELDGMQDLQRFARSSAVLTTYIKAMKKKKWVTTRRKQKNLRQVSVTLTPDGEQLLLDVIDASINIPALLKWRLAWRVSMLRGRLMLMLAYGRSSQSKIAAEMGMVTGSACDIVTRLGTMGLVNYKRHGRSGQSVTAQKATVTLTTRGTQCVRELAEALGEPSASGATSTEVSESGYKSETGGAVGTSKKARSSRKPKKPGARLANL